MAFLKDLSRPLDDAASCRLTAPRFQTLLETYNDGWKRLELGSPGLFSDSRLIYFQRSVRCGQPIDVLFFRRIPRIGTWPAHIAHPRAIWLCHARLTEYKLLPCPSRVGAIKISFLPCEIVRLSDDGTILHRLKPFAGAKLLYSVETDCSTKLIAPGDLASVQKSTAQACQLGG